MTDKKYCMSSYLAFRYINKDDKEFYNGMSHELIDVVAENERVLVHTSKDREGSTLINRTGWIGWVLSKIQHRNVGNKSCYLSVGGLIRFVFNRESD